MPPPGRRSLLDHLRAGTPQTLGPELPGGTEVVDPQGRFAFRAPWPWFEVPPDELDGATALGAPADVVVCAPRTDHDDPLFWLVIDDQEIDLEQVNPKRLLRNLLAPAGLAPDDVQRILLDGRPAVLAQARSDAAADDVALVLLAPYDAGCVRGRADVPRAQARGYRSHIVSMLASWRWAR